MLAWIFYQMSENSLQISIDGPKTDPIYPIYQSNKEFADVKVRALLQNWVMIVLYSPVLMVGGAITEFGLLNPSGITESWSK